MNANMLSKPATTSTWVLRIVIYSALLLLVSLVVFIPIVTTAQISIKMILSSTPSH
jgi:hypothetical protein